MFCRRCGAQIPEDSTFCPRCGTPAVIVSPPDISTLPGEQFVPPPPPWQPPMPGGPYPGGPASVGPRPPSPPITHLLFGSPPQQGAPLTHRNRAQRWLLSRMRPSAASSVWIGAVVGSLLAFALVLLLSIAFSLTLGPTLDQSTLGALSAGQTSSSSNSTYSLYSNPLIVLAYAHRTTMNEKVTLGGLGTNLSTTASVTLPITLLLLIPAIGLIIGGYFAASTNYSGRRLYSITRGASIGILYALLLLLISLVTSTSSTINLGTGTVNASESLNISPDAVSALFSGLLCGVVFGALGGALQSRFIPPMMPTRPVNPAWTHVRGALKGAAGALVVYFVLCLILVIALYIAAQFGGPVLQGEGSPSLTGSGSSTCHVFLKEPDPTAQPGIKADFPTHVFYAIYSPVLAQWVMTISMGAPLQISGSGITINFGLFNADCQPGPKGTLLYLLLFLPAISVFIGGWMAARSAQARTAKEAAGIGLLLAPLFAILFLLLNLLTSISQTASVSGLGLGSTTTLGAATGWTLLASLLFGGVFGMLGSIAGRPRHLPPLKPSIAPAWPATPGAWSPAAQPPVPPTISPAVASFHPAPPEPAPDGPGDQPPDQPTSSAPSDTMLPSEEPPPT